MKLKQKILWIDPANFLGGAEFFSLDVLPLLADKFELTVLTNSADSEYAQKLPKNIAVEFLKFPRLKPLNLSNLRNFFHTTQELRAFLLQNRFDLIQTNSIRAHIVTGQVLKKIQSEHRPKLIFFVHDFTFPRWAIRLFSGKADEVIACSEAVKQDLIRKGIAAEKISVVPNGADVDRFSRIPRKVLNPEEPVIGMLGRIDRWKGQDIFLKAGLEVLKTFPKVRFKIFGTSSPYDSATKKFEQELREFVRHNNLERSFEFRGFKSLEGVFAEIDLLVHASTAPEPFGRVIIEALAAGIPVIASNLGGPSEIFSDGVHGLLIPPKDPLLLAQKIIGLCSSEKLLRQFSEQGKELVRSRFSLTHVVELIGANWKKLLG